MGKAIFIQPTLRIAQQLKEAGGATIAELLEEAHDNLGAMKPRAVTELQLMVQDLHACFQGFPKEFSREALMELYGKAARGVGVGALCDCPGADQALVSLCRLLDHLAERKRWDIAPIAVHVQTLQLLSVAVQKRMDAAAFDQILGGLLKVSARYAA